MFESSRGAFRCGTRTGTSGGDAWWSANPALEHASSMESRSLASRALPRDAGRWQGVSGAVSGATVLLIPAGHPLRAALSCKRTTAPPLQSRFGAMLRREWRRRLGNLSQRNGVVLSSSLLEASDECGVILRYAPSFDPPTRTGAGFDGRLSGRRVPVRQSCYPPVTLPRVDHVLHAEGGV